MPTPAASVADFKAFFVRDFNYGATPDLVMDADVTKALATAASVFNDALWADAAERATPFLYASAHYLVLSLQAAGGLSAVNLSRGAKNHGGGTIQTKSVGSVSVAFALSESLTNDPILSQFQSTDYGRIYLGMLAPRLVGNVDVVAGWNDTGAPDGL